jgi:hypothetical protein
MSAVGGSGLGIVISAVLTHDQKAIPWCPLLATSPTQPVLGVDPVIKAWRDQRTQCR